MASLIADLSIDWNEIRCNEMKSDDWNKIAQHWKDRVVQKISTSGHFKVGGDRISVTARGVKQLAVVEYAQQLALQRSLEDDDHAVSDDVVDAVSTRFRGTTDDATMRMRRIVRRVTRRVRVRQRNPGAAAANDRAG